MMDDNTLDNGKTVIWMVQESLYIQTELYTKDNLKTIKKQVMVYINGQMEENIKAIGTKENSMVLEYYMMKVK